MISPVLRKRISRTRRKLVLRAGLAYAGFAMWTRPANPDFIIIGPARSATAWLHRRLSVHPDVFMPRIKEIHFFDTKTGDGRYVFDLRNPAHWRWYWSYFQAGREKVSGDATPAYSGLPIGRVEEITRHLPDAKFIYSIRNPVERAWSGVRHSFWYGSGRLPGHADTDRISNMIVEQQLLEKGDHRANIQKWEKCAGQDRLHCIFYDDIIERPKIVLESIVDFIGLDPARLPSSPEQGNRVNALQDGSMPDAVREMLSDYYRDQVKYLEDKFSRPLSSWGLQG